MVTDFRKSPLGLSREIQSRLHASYFETEPVLKKLLGQIEELAKSVNHHFGAEWHADRSAHKTFVDVVKRLLDDRPEPEAQLSSTEASPAISKIIYTHYLSTVRALEQRTAEMVPTTRQQVRDK
jgi:hypothetical protein